MNELITGEVRTMSSRLIAELTGKAHKNVLNDIRVMAEQLDLELGGLIFQLSEYVGLQNKKHPEYLLTKKESLLVISGYDVNMRLAIINRWEQLELEKPEYTLESVLNNPEFAIKALLEIKNEREKNLLLSNENERLRPRDEFVSLVFESKSTFTVGEASKLLKLDYGRNTLFDVLRKEGMIFQNGREPKQEYVERGYFEVKATLVPREGNTPIVSKQTLVTQKGLAYIAKKLNIIITNN